MLVHRRVTPSITFASTHLYILVERGTVTVERLAQEHNTMSPARAQTRTARSGCSLTMRTPTVTIAHLKTWSERSIVSVKRFIQIKQVVTWCLRTYIGLRPYMVNVYIKERINDQKTICAGGVTSNTTYLG